MSLSALVSTLRQLTPDQLHERNQAARLELARSEWTMAVHLLATERAGLHRLKGYGDVLAYAEKLLDLSRHKALELLRVARCFEAMPDISEAFRRAELCWTKVREITRVATPATENAWLERARKHDANTVARMVAVSPTEYKRGKARQAERQAQETLPESESPLSAAPEVLPQLITVTLRFTPEQYAVLEQAISLARARAGKRVNREAALVSLAEGSLSSADSRSKVRHQVSVWVDPESGQGFYDTERGPLPAPMRVVEEALVPAGRKKIPADELKAVFARAEGRCENCGCKGGPLQVHHCRPVARGGRNLARELRLLCPACHGVVHEEDFARDPGWRAAKEAATSVRKTEAFTSQPLAARGDARPGDLKAGMAGG
ncbi:MAG: HNH endonuclease [Vulcanimicrobiota bacterium]